MKFLPIKEFENSQKSIDLNSKQASISSMMEIKTEVIEKKKKSQVRF